MHRSSSDGMVKESDPETEKVKRRNDRKRAKALRSALASRDMKAVATIFIETRGVSQHSVIDEECADCRQLNHRSHIVPLHTFAVPS